MAIGTRLRGILDELIATGYPERAEAMGFDPSDVQYHGTKADFTEFAPSDFGNVGPGIYMSSNPEVASGYASRNLYNPEEGAQVMPLMTRGETIGMRDYFAQYPDTLISQMPDTNAELRELGITAINEAAGAPDKAVFDPRDVRSLFAAFDPEYIQGGSQSPSLLNAATQSAVGAASMATPEAPESALYEGLTDKMVDYLTEQMGGSEEDRERAEYISMGAAKGVSETFDAYKNDDTLGMALGAGGILAGMIPFGRGAYKSALGIAEDSPVVTRDTGLLQRVGDPESVNTMKLDVEPGVDLAPSRLLSAEDLEGRGFVSGMADTSRGDLSRVVSVNDQPVDMVRFGGQDYMRQPQNVEKGVLWASDAGAVTGLSNAARAASQLPGVNRSPVYIPYQMGGASTDFATMTSDIMVPIARQNMKKADKKALDKRIREGAGTKTGEFKPQPDWPGIDSPKADEWLANDRRVP